MSNVAFSHTFVDQIFSLRLLFSFLVEVQHFFAWNSVAWARTGHLKLAWEYGVVTVRSDHCWPFFCRPAGRERTPATQRMRNESGQWSKFLISKKQSARSMKSSAPGGCRLLAFPQEIVPEYIARRVHRISMSLWTVLRHSSFCVSHLNCNVHLHQS